MKPIANGASNTAHVVAFKRPVGAILGQADPIQKSDMVSFPTPPQVNPTKAYLQQETESLSQLKGEDREWKLDQFMGLVNSKNTQELEEFKSLLLELVKNLDPSDDKRHRATMDMYNIVRHKLNAQWRDQFNGQHTPEGSAHNTIDLL